MILRRVRIKRVARRGGPLKRWKGPRKVRKTSRAKMGRIADRLFSLIVRHAQVCAFHGDPWAPGNEDGVCSGPLQCAHIVSRTYRSVRWDESNAMPLCAGAHVAMTHRPLEWERFVVYKIGREALDELKAQALEVWDGDIEGVLVRLAARAVALGLEAK